MATATTTTTTTTTTTMSETMATSFTGWADKLRSTEQSGRAAVLQSETDAFVAILDDMHAFGSWLTSDVLPLVATITGDAVESITGDKVRACMARTGTAMSADADTRANFPSAATMSRAMQVAANDSPDYREQWLSASTTSATGKVTRNPRRWQDYVQVINVANGGEHGTKSAIDWKATLSGGTYSARTRKYSRKGDAPVTIGMLTRKSVVVDETTDVVESTDESVVISSDWRDLFALADDALIAVRDDVDGFDVSADEWSDADALIMARQLIARLTLSARATARVSK